MNQKEIRALAQRHGLRLKEGLRFNEMGIDFKVAHAIDVDDQDWVLRIPRRDGLSEQIERERKILSLMQRRLSISVPDWKIAHPTFIAYPLLAGDPVVTYDAATYEVTWNIDKETNRLASSLANVLVELHRIPQFEAADAGLTCSTITQVRHELLNDIQLVKREIGIGAELERRWRSWIDADDYWPDFTTFVHGDLYAGHILSDRSGNVSGIIDWSEAQISDPSIDFSGHFAVFADSGLKELISEYEALGGKVWEKMFEHTRERHSASPLKYAVFALRNDLDEHIKAARTQLNAGD